uniref:G-protein coupled receptors family 1 profile domain-containing protein n=1 Tax=Globodera rostochiensis TaxID=31243 RepID=A0A914IC36_GLORO
MDGGEKPSLAPSASHVFAPPAPLASSPAPFSPNSAPSLGDVLLNFHSSHLPHSQPSEVQLFIYGFVLVLIPTATILGNVLVIISVLRFKSLHSAINFLILGLAIADLMVALFVMPYAVYVYVQGGRWLLGPLMCNLYLSSDVACSTASIILLALISFDRYQAISHPIQYSRQAQNIARVVRLFVGVWVYSLLVASPIVLGFNDPPPPDNTSGVFEPFECRFYSPWFSLLSSLVSFLLPCCVVIFVYVRIIRALRRRERAAKARKQAAANSAAHHQQATASASERAQFTSGQQMESEEAGEIVAGPAINMMMIALPSLNRQMRRYERHRRALEEAAIAEDELSSSDSLSDDVRILTNDFFSEVLTSNSKASASLEPPGGSHTNASLFGGFRASFSGAMDLRKKSMAEEIVPTIFVPRKRSACDFGTFSSPREVLRKNTAPMKIRLASVRDANSERRENEMIGRCQLLSPCAGSVDWSAPTSRKNSEMPRGNVQQQRRHRQQHVTARRGALSFPLVRRIALGRDIRVNHYLLNDGEDTSEDLIVPDRTTTTAVLHMSNGGGRVLLGEAEVQSVHRQNGGGESPKTRNGAFFGSVSFRGPSLAVPSLPPFRRGNSAIELGGRRAAEDDDDSKELPKTTSARMANDNVTKEAEQNERARNTVVLSADTVPNSLRMPKAAVTGTASLGTEKPPPPPPAPRVAVAQQQSEQGSRRDRHASLRRKVHKSQRKEKRATKTLGIVVGTFLCCWVPFFSLNIANALCVEMDAGWCQIGFGPFFYSTWIGYMNSFMNPVIYTIFNAEFRRAFKSLLLGRRGNTFARRN